MDKRQSRHCMLTPASQVNIHAAFNMLIPTGIGCSVISLIDNSVWQVIKERSLTWAHGRMDGKNPTTAHQESLRLRCRYIASISGEIFSIRLRWYQYSKFFTLTRKVPQHVYLSLIFELLLTWYLKTMLSWHFLPITILVLQSCCIDVGIWDNKDCHGGTNWYGFLIASNINICWLNQSKHYNI